MGLMGVLIGSIATLEVQQRAMCVWPTLLCTFFVSSVSLTSFLPYHACIVSGGRTDLPDR